MVVGLIDTLYVPDKRFANIYLPSDSTVMLRYTPDPYISVPDSKITTFPDVYVSPVL